MVGQWLHGTLAKGSARMLQHYVVLTPGAMDTGVGCGAHLQGNTTLVQQVRRNGFIIESATPCQILILQVSKPVDCRLHQLAHHQWS